MPSNTELIVGLGASAGGLEAYKRFFDRMPADSGMAFVLVQHLAPDQTSVLAELLQRHTKMEVLTAEEGMRVGPNCVFVIPPDATLTIRNGHLHIEKPAPARAHRFPVDAFFSSLAEDSGERAVAIILSGGGSDGSLGLKSIKEHGGFTLAQAEDESRALQGMPQSASATGLVDFVMLVEDMPSRLLEYQQHLLDVGAHKGADGTRQSARDSACSSWTTGLQDPRLPSHVREPSAQGEARSQVAYACNGPLGHLVHGSICKCSG